MTSNSKQLKARRAFNARMRLRGERTLLRESLAAIDKELALFEKADADLLKTEFYGRAWRRKANS
jgi:hypothetical protein